MWAAMINYRVPRLPLLAIFGYVGFEATLFPFQWQTKSNRFFWREALLAIEAKPLGVVFFAVPRLVAFEVPRLHEVSAVRKGHARYSLFGWWLVEDAPHAPHALLGRSPAAVPRVLLVAKRL